MVCAPPTVTAQFGAFGSPVKVGDAMLAFSPTEDCRLVTVLIFAMVHFLTSYPPSRRCYEHVFRGGSAGPDFGASNSGASTCHGNLNTRPSLKPCAKSQRAR